ncbi:MAG: DUF5615 family PIN-like protein [Actinobacteria bacterium]|nr:DUF5615 family PIN-like protein [Actinomycetota bacterium]
MRFLLDENFPIQLRRRLISAGHEADHILSLGRRGMADAEIRQRLIEEPDLVFLTQDTEFLQLTAATTATVIISRVPQSLRLADRVEVWGSAIDAFAGQLPDRGLFELLATGVVVPLPEA